MIGLGMTCFVLGMAYMIILNIICQQVAQYKDSNYKVRCLKAKCEMQKMGIQARDNYIKIQEQQIKKAKIRCNK